MQKPPYHCLHNSKLLGVRKYIILLRCYYLVLTRNILLKDCMAMEFPCICIAMGSVKFNSRFAVAYVIYIVLSYTIYACYPVLQISMHVNTNP